MKTIPGIKFVHAFPHGEEVLSMATYGDQVVICTSRAVYRAAEGKVEEIKIHYDAPERQA